MGNRKWRNNIYPVQYVLMGNKKEFKDIKIQDVEIHLAKSYPDTGIEEDHFLIDLYPIKLPWNIEKEY